MKKLYFLTLLFSISSILATAQVNLPQVNPTPVPGPYTSKGKIVNNKTTSCIDTVYYPRSKMTGAPEADTMSFANYITAVSQAYHLSGTGTVRGIRAYMLLDLDGIPGNTSPVSMIIKVANIDTLNKPTTTIDSAIVTVSDVGYNEQTLMFSSPVTVSDSFAVIIALNPAAPSVPYYTTNSSAANDGGTEGLSCIEYGQWFHNYTQLGGWDIDMLLYPIFEQSHTASFTVSKDSICPNKTVDFTNTSPKNNDKMFNLFAKNNSPLYEWDFDDGTGTYNPVDTTYTFVNIGQYNTELKVFNYGHTVTCVDSSQHVITVVDTAISNFGFTDLGGGNIQFHDSSMYGKSYMWYFGDGDTSTAQNPTHLYSSNGNYTACLVVTSEYGCNTDSYCLNVPITVGLSEVNTHQVINVYPIPAKGHVNVDIPANYYQAEIVITDLVGKTIDKIPVKDRHKLRILTDGIDSGVYFISLDMLGDRIFTQRIIIDK